MGDNYQEVLVISPSLSTRSKLYSVDVDGFVGVDDRMLPVTKIRFKFYGPEALNPDFIRVLGSEIGSALEDLASAVERDNGAEV